METQSFFDLFSYSYHYSLYYKVALVLIKLVQVKLL